MSCWDGRNGLVHGTFFIRQLICWHHMGSINVSGFVDESRSNTRLSLNLRWFFLWLFFFYGIDFYLLVNVVVDLHLLPVVLQLYLFRTKLDVQLCVLYALAFADAEISKVDLLDNE